MKLKLIAHTSNYEALRLRVQLGNFLAEVVVLNSDKKSQIHRLHNISDTSASVFVSSSILKGTAVKCTHFDK